MSELGQDARDLIEQALRDEIPAEQAELVRIRRRVLAASAGASVFGISGKAVAMLGKASLGPVLKAFGVGVAVTVLAIGLPMVLSKEPAAKRAAVAATVATTARPAPPKTVTVDVDANDLPTTLAAPTAAVPMLDQRRSVSADTPASASNRVAPAIPAIEPTSTQGHSPSAIDARPAPAPVVAAGVTGTTAGTTATIPGTGTTATAASARLAETAGQTQSLSVPTSAGKVHSSSPLVQELTLLENVQSELRAGHGALALKLLDGSSFPEGGQLQAERLAAEVFAACQAGKPERARAAARSFLSKYPSSPASGRVRGSCGGEEAGNAR